MLAFWGAEPTSNYAFKPIAELALRSNQTIVPQRLNAALGLPMKDCRVLLAFLAVLLGAPVSAELAESESELLGSEKDRIAVLAEGALKDGEISQSQYRSTMYWLNTYPCSVIERAASGATKVELESAIAANEKWVGVKILGFFKFENWRIVYVSNGVSDEPYLFYSGDPMTSKSLGAWGGAATIFETEDIKNWTVKTFPQVPQELARCFAWHVTLNRR